MHKVGCNHPCCIVIVRAESHRVFIACAKIRPNRNVRVISYHLDLCNLHRQQLNAGYCNIRPTQQSFRYCNRRDDKRAEWRTKSIFHVKWNFHRCCATAYPTYPRSLTHPQPAAAAAAGRISDLISWPSVAPPSGYSLQSHSCDNKITVCISKRSSCLCL